jgi:hypothetical protein
VWKAELATAPNGAFRAQFGTLITYRVVSRTYCYPAYLELRGWGGGLKRLDLGRYVNIEQAKRACERHCATGCDLSRAERIEECAGRQALTGNEMLLALGRRLLSLKGFDVGDIDGIIGPRTRRTVVAFQRQQSLEPSGQIDGRTASALGLSIASTSGRNAQ